MHFNEIRKHVADALEPLITVVKATKDRSKRIEEEQRTAKNALAATGHQIKLLGNKMSEIFQVRQIMNETKEEVSKMEKRMTDRLEKCSMQISEISGKVDNADDELRQFPQIIKERDKRFWALEETMSALKVSMANEWGAM